MSQRKSADTNFISKLFFCWLEPLVWKGWRNKSLSQEDLYQLPDEARARDLHCLFQRHWNRELERRQCGKKARLSWALLKCIWSMVLLSSILFLIEAGVLVAQSVLVGFIAEYFSLPSPSPEERRAVYIQAGALGALSFLLSLVHNHLYFICYRMGMHLRIITTATIFQKVLRLSLLMLGRVTSGHVINLVSNDARRLDDSLYALPILWIAPLVTLAVGWLSWREVGPSCLAGIGFIILTVLLQLALAKALVRLRSKVVLVTDWRVKVMNEVIAGMKAIKVYAWEHAFQSLITKIRSKESRILTVAGIIRGSQLTLFFTSLTFSSFFTFVTYTSTGNDITLKRVFTVVTLFGVLSLFTVGWFTHGLTGIVEYLVAIRRIQSMLELEELPSPTPAIAPPTTPPIGKQAKEEKPVFSEFATPTIFPLPADEEKAELRLPFVAFKDVCIWSEGYSSCLLEEVTFLVNQGNRLVVIIGPVGSGKSTILHTIMREHQPKNGSVLSSGGVSLVGQEAWIFSGTVQENILFGHPLKPDWYCRVVHACGLEEDIASFPNGDLTPIGERGIGLSGGQRSRVSLARAVYRDTDIYLLDDPLSAVDTAVARHIFQHCIQGLLGNRLILLVTHQLHYAQEADKILVLEEGQQRGFGSYSSLKSSGLDVGDLLRLMGEGQEEGEGQTDVHLQTSDVRMPTSRAPNHTHCDNFLRAPSLTTSLSALSQLSLHSELHDEEMASIASSRKQKAVVHWEDVLPGLAELTVDKAELAQNLTDCCDASDFLNLKKLN